jgi:hypothetical protein
VNALQALNETMRKTVPVGPFRNAAIRDRRNVRLTLDLDFPHPFVVRFEGGQFSLTFRARRVRLGDGPILPAHDVTLSYRVSVGQDGAVQFDMQGDPRVLPRDGSSDAPRELVAAVRSELFADLRPAFTVDPGGFFSGGLPLPLGVRAFSIDQGWLAGSIEVRLPSSRPATAATAAAE